LKVIRPLGRTDYSFIIMSIIKIMSLCISLASVQLAVAQMEGVTFEQADSLQQLDARPIVVFIGTDWCRYCKKMTHTTFQAAAVVDLLSQHYYFVAFNAEDKNSIRFGGHDFHFKPTGTNTGIHELAEALATIDGQVSYPTVCMLNKQYEIIFQYAGFIGEQEFTRVLEELK
jgi:thioredoxin-related protein